MPSSKNASSRYCSPAEIHRIIRESINDFSLFDFNLLHVNASEMSIAHRLAIYIERRLPGWHVDCEYNRDLTIPKTRGSDKRKIRLDINVHCRGSAINLLAIEIKKTKHRKSVIEAERIRVRELSALWTSNLPHYCHSLLLVFPVKKRELAVQGDPEVSCHWFHRRGCGASEGGEPFETAKAIKLKRDKKSRDKKCLKSGG
ncbi:hypothetical protein DTL21_07790 [Bremerella cremea]|uniref:Uncharacterized protein n=1 Tax=Blastopirellula marina TaxID=124 RepID=A0A2S8G079_9BACT|nr:hypothetical protein C5Y83_07785 [Blastopirellula marina]RCS50221.1 hypothetical protein DTL21_07790 [Bremerella cremea]